MPRPPRPDDLFALRVPIEVALSPGGDRVAFVVKSVAPGRDGYRHALWIVPADGSAPARQLTLGRRTDIAPRWSPDGRTLAFLSDRSGIMQAAGAGDEPGPKEAPKEGGTQVWLLPIEGGEARQLTRLPRDVTDLTWSPDGTALCVVSASRDASRSDRPRASRRTVPRRTCASSTASRTCSTGPASPTTARATCGGSRSPTGACHAPDERHLRRPRPAWSPDGTHDRLRVEPPPPRGPHRARGRLRHAGRGRAHRAGHERRRRPPVLRSGLEPRRGLAGRQGLHPGAARACGPTCGGSGRAAATASART